MHFECINSVRRIRCPVMTGISQSKQMKAAMARKACAEPNVSAICMYRMYELRYGGYLLTCQNELNRESGSVYAAWLKVDKEGRAGLFNKTWKKNTQLDD